ncbi:MAG: PEP-CTERM sorting domain-containing protein, partial [Myxococcota bacterium]
DYFVSVGPVETSGVFGAHDSTDTLPDIVAQSFSFTNTTPLVASLSISNGTLELTGITLAILPPSSEGADALLVKADVTWSGAIPVPEPSSVALAIAGALLVGFAARRAN